MTTDDRSLVWTIVAIAGPLLFLTFYNKLLACLRSVLNQRSRKKSVLRGGRFSSNTAYNTKKNQTIFFQMSHATLVLPLFIIYRLLTFVYKCFAKLVKSTRNVSFQKHSDGSISSQKYYFDRNEAPSLGPMDNIPTPLMDEKRPSIHARVATPIPKTKQREKMGLFGIATKERNYNSHSNHIRGKENRDPQPYRNEYAPMKSWPELKPKSLSIESQNTQSNLISSNSKHQKSTSLVLRKQSAVSKQSSPFHETPMKPNFLIPYASSTPSSSLFHNDYQSSVGFTKSLQPKRSFKLTADDNDDKFSPRKRMALTHGNENARKGRKPIDPEKRKQRQELLLKEFNRKRPKVEDRPVSAGSQLGNKEQSSVALNDVKPTFQFGTTKVETNVGSTTNSTSKQIPSVTAITVNAEQSNQNATATPALAETKTDAKPSFSFGGSSVTASVSNKSTGGLEAPKASVAFNDKPASSQGHQGKSDSNKPAVSLAAADAKPTFSFGENQTKASSEATKPVLFGTGAASSVPAASASTTDKPSFAFGATQSSTETNANSNKSSSTFSFGGSNSAASTAPKFGVPPPSAPSAPIVSVTSNKPTNATQSATTGANVSTPAFAFSGSNSTAPAAPTFGVPQSTFQQQPPPAMPSAAARRKAAQRKGRSRRGVA